MFAASKTKQVTAAGTSDPFFPYVPLLLETTSTNGQQNNTFLDSSTNNFTITRNGTPTQGSVTPYWPNGYWGNYFNGSTDYFTLPSNAVLTLTANFTIEFWVYSGAFASGASNPSLINTASASIFYESSGSNRGLCLFVGSAIITTATTVLPNNQWNHVVCVRSGTTVSMFVNGSRVGTNASFSSTADFSGAFVNRYYASSAGYLNGYMSNLRVVKGTAVYDPTLTTLTVPTTPLTPITNTSLLTCQSNRFIDNSNSASPLTVTVVGTPRVQAFQPFSPVASYTTATYGGSGYFNGSTDYLSNASISALTFGTADFTVEYWVYCPALPGLSFICAGNGASSTDIVFGFQTSSAPYCSSSVNFPVYTNTVVPINAWTHIAFVRASGTWKLWMNGVDVTVGSQSNPNVTTSTLGIGAASGGGSKFTGYISNLRVVKGTAVYTGAFTPPTLAPITTAGSTSAASYSSTTNVNTSFASSATSLLTNFTNAGIYDAAVQNNAITVGSAQASTTVAKWSPTSMSFNGTTSSLTIPTNPAFAFGTGDFTIECWVYPTSQGGHGSSNSDCIIDFRPGVGSGVYGTLYIFNSGTSVNWYVNGAVRITGAAISNNTWTYLAVTKASGNTKLYINGTQSGSTYVDANSYLQGPVSIGQFNDGTGGGYFAGYIQDVRITKYARTITTPTAAFPTR